MANRIVDNLIAYRILSMLVTPFKDTKAYDLGIIDEKGKILKKATSLRTTQEKDSYNYLTRLVFNVKRIINKLPGGESKLRNIVAAFFLIKESYESGNRSTSLLERKIISLVEKMDSGISFIDEELTVSQYMTIFEDAAAGAPANAVGDGTRVSTDYPKIKGRKFASFNVNDDVFRRFQKGKKKYKRWSEYLNLQDEAENEIYKFARKNPKAVIVLKNGDMTKAIRFNRTGGGAWSKITNRKLQGIEVQVN